MKRITDITPVHTRKAYTPPQLNIVVLSLGCIMLTQSEKGQKKNLDIYEEEEWPTDPETQQPYTPW